MRKRLLAFAFLIAAAAFVLCACGGGLTAELDRESAVLEVGEELKLRATPSEEDAVVEWAVSDENILSFVPNRNSVTVTAMDSGEAFVYAKSGDKILAQCKITVPELPKLSVFLPQGVLVLAGSTSKATVTAKAHPSLSGTPVWTSADTSVVTVESQGLIAIVSAHKIGQTTLTVELGGETATIAVYVGRYS